MHDFVRNFERSIKRSKLFPIILLSLLVVIVVSTIIFSIIEATKVSPTYEVKETTSGSEEDEEVILDETLVIDDIYYGERVIPKYDIDVNTLATEDFQVIDDQVIYDGAYIGIDVSAYQGDIDWEAVAATGIDFAIIRVGYRGATLGAINEDTYFETNIQGALDAGLKVGVYFFSQAITVEEAEEEASFVIGKISGYDIDYPVIFDWENVTIDDARTDSISGDDVTEFAATFLKKLDKAGYNTAVYFNKSQAYNFYDLEKLDDYDFWYAEYKTAPSLYYSFDIWQYSESGTVNGISEKVDINISFKDYKN